MCSLQNLSHLPLREPTTLNGCQSARRVFVSSEGIYLKVLCVFHNNRVVFINSYFTFRDSRISFYPLFVPTQFIPRKRTGTLLRFTMPLVFTCPGLKNFRSPRECFFHWNTKLGSMISSSTGSHQNRRSLCCSIRNYGTRLEGILGFIIDLLSEQATLNANYLYSPSWLQTSPDLKQVLNTNCFNGTYIPQIP